MKFKIIVSYCIGIFIVIGVSSFSTLPYFTLPAMSFNTTPYHLKTPEYFPEMFIPPKNPLTVEGIALGRKLFYEPLLSGNNKMSCGTCHQQKYAFSDSAVSFSTGIDGVQGKRNTMPIFNLGWVNTGLFWDGRSPDLESQVIEPVQNPIEMHESLNNAVTELQNSSEYPRLFKRAFGSRIITVQMLTKAIAQFERTIVSSNSRYDKYARKEPGGYLTAEEKRGLSLYFNDLKGKCSVCHSLGGTFTNSLFKNTGLDSVEVDEGRYLITCASNDMGRFRTPSLRNIELTAPYMHDGRFQTLYQVLDHYNGGFKSSPYTDKEIYKRRKGNLSADEKECIIKFLKTLTDYDLITNPKFSNPN